MIRYRTITTIDAEYAQEKELRELVLRKPLGLSLSSHDLRGEEEQAHIVAQDDDGRVVGCVLLLFAQGTAKARQLAVDEAWRGKGIGRELMHHAEEAARQCGHDRLVLHGRVTSAPFFERLGYQIVSEVFTEVTIPHVRLEKELKRAGQ